MVDLPLVRRRLDALLRYLGLLEPFTKTERQAFVDDPSIHNLAERYLHLATEAAIDIANHIISDAHYEAPETYRSSFAVLEKNGVLETDLSQRMQSWAGFRNILVHEYIDIDHNIAYDAIARDLGDLHEFATLIGDLL